MPAFSRALRKGPTDTIMFFFLAAANKPTVPKIGNIRNVNTLHSSVVQLRDDRFRHQHSVVMATKQSQLADAVEVE